jgi:outer membrane protein assembly factor BamB
VPLSPIEYIDDLTPAVSGPSVGLLANVISGGRDQTHEAAFFLPVGSDGLGKPARISRGGPQFQTMIGIGRGEFIVAGDQEPLTLLKLDSTGRVLWRRSFSSKLVLPTVSAGSSGTIFLVSKNGSYNLLQVFDPAGRVVGSTRVAAEWADVAADAGGGCSVLFSNEWKGKDRTVYLLTFDRSLRRVLQVATPLRGQGGRTYHLVTTPRGHLVIGEGAVLTPPSKDQRNIVAEFDSTGALLWQQEIAALSATIAPFASGFYAVRKLFLHKGIDVEKYAYK